MTFAASVLEKLSALRAADPDFSVFGAASHRYELNAPCAEQDVRAFETEHDVQLPEDYRDVLVLRHECRAQVRSVTRPFSVRLRRFNLKHEISSSAKTLFEFFCEV